MIDYSAPMGERAGPGIGAARRLHDAQFAAYAPRRSRAATAPAAASGRSIPGFRTCLIRMYEIWNEENGDYFWDTGREPGRLRTSSTSPHAAAIHAR